MTSSSAAPKSPLAFALWLTSPLGIAASISLTLHLVVVPVAVSQLHRLAPSFYSRLLEETPLEVILVNAASDEAPSEAQALAQHNLSGGGNLDEKGVFATSPLLPSQREAFGTELSPTKSQTETEQPSHSEKSAAETPGEAPSLQDLAAMQRKQMDLLAQVKQQIDSLSAVVEQLPAGSAEAQELEKKRQLLLNAFGKIDRRIQEENSRPRRRYIAPSTVKGPQALYYDKLKTKIEEKGTANFPTHNGVKLYGELILRIVVNHDGRVIETRVMRSSGNRMLDRRAEAIAVSAGPFGKFDTALRRYTDELAVISRFKFERNNTLSTQVSTTQDLVDAADAEASAPASP
ncbi:MAG: energy transducer TonB [Brachymonas sp.]|nr:energy transducer TonB [Brachymonas sp.]